MPGSAIGEPWGPAVLPAPLSTFIGRERQLDEIEQLLTAGRLVTLTGPGGCGKTRLALVAAARLRHAFPDDMVFVPLAPVGDPSFVAHSVARALGIGDSSGRSYRETVSAALWGRALLLVLDNFEHLLDAAPLVTEWLAACPGLRVLATSRERLRLQGEQVYPVPPLGVPDSAGGDSREAEAVRLFADRARAVDPSFSLSDETTPTVAEICRRLDGLPLAIELAAARIGLLPPAAMLAQVRGVGRVSPSRLALLVGGPRDLPIRHQTLRRTIAWSYELLDDDEQRLFRRLSIFAGGCTLEAAEAVCADREDAASAPPVSVLEGLASLIDKSLLQQVEHATGEPRFAMLATIRELAVERLVASGEAAELRRRHAQYYLEQAEHAEPELRGPRQVSWLDRLEAEHENLRAALSWWSDQDTETALRLGAALREFWDVRAHCGEGREYLAALLARPAALGRTVARASALDAQGALARKQGEYAAASALHEESLGIWRELGDRRAAAYALSQLGIAAIVQGDAAGAVTLLRESLAISRELDDRWNVAMSASGLGLASKEQGDLVIARALHEEALTLWRAAGDLRRVAYALNNLGAVAFAQGRHAEARALREEALDIWRQMGDRWGVGYALNNLAWVVYEQGDHATACALHQESLRLMWDHGDRWVIASCLEGLAAAHATADRAARLYGAADALRETLQAPVHGSERAAHDRKVAAARGQLGAEAFARAWADGRAMSLEQAIAEALAVTPSAGAVEPASKAVADRRRLTGGLTAREAEVARLVAEGKTNREIAEALVVSERTVGTHLNNIFARLGVSSRTAVAAFVVRHGLA